MRGAYACDLIACMRQAHIHVLIRPPYGRPHIITRAFRARWGTAYRVPQTGPYRLFLIGPFVWP